MGFTSIIYHLIHKSENKYQHNHKYEKNNQFVPKIIINHKNLNSSNVFLRSFDYFPNVKSHISEATYYRLFMEDYIKNDFYIYLDVDVVC